MKCVRTLAIETSCDETAAAVLEHPRRLLANVVSSQVPLHARYGGVVPEVASRGHQEVLWPVVSAALEQANLSLQEVDLVAVTAGPGLIGALMVGVSFAKGLAFGLGKPMVGVNHLVAHIAANLLSGDFVYPALALVVSGGHTDLVLVCGPTDYRLLGSTLDDAAGEAFDKVARLLGLGYPGGPAIERAAQDGHAHGVSLPMVHTPEPLDFSFSGLKTAVSALVTKAGAPTAADVAAAFQQRVVGLLVEKTKDALQRTQARSLLLAGGVAANRALRAALGELAAVRGLPFQCPPLALCTDNAAMVALAGDLLYHQGLRSGLDLTPRADLSNYRELVG